MFCYKRLRAFLCGSHRSLLVALLLLLRWVAPALLCYLLRLQIFRLPTVACLCASPRAALFTSSRPLCSSPAIQSFVASAWCCLGQPDAGAYHLPLPASGICTSCWPLLVLFSCSICRIMAPFAGCLVLPHLLRLPFDAAARWSSAT